MSKILFIFLTVWILNVDCNYDDRAKIRISDGNLYLEPARGKNIYLYTNGPRSSVFIGDTNLINGTFKRSGPSQAQSFEVDTLSYASNDMLRRLQALESLNLVSHDEFMANVSALSLRISRISGRLSRLHHQIYSWIGDQCQQNTCQNGGTCLNLVGDFHCLCPSNWEGRNCEIDVNECRNFAGTDLGCQNGADCINKPGTYECHCRSGWFGTHCTRRKMDCSAGNFEMCGHGTCVPVTSGEGIKCICDQGWTTNGSVTCLTDVNECDTTLGSRCSTNPKVECINLPGSFRCGQCPPGFQGDGYACYDVNECVTSNGGCSSMVSCHNTIGSRICGACPSGYVGDGVTCSWRGSCGIDHGGCHPSATCIENSGVRGGVQCECPQGMDGDGLGIHGCYISTNNRTKSCKSNPCGLNGRCHTLRDGYTCICLRGFSGAHCDVREQKCVINPCKNGGLCRPDRTMALGFRCECTAQYTGTLCQERSRCGSILYAEEGSLVYPLSNTTYGSNSKCAWIIRTVSEKVINVTFTRFNLERSPDCHFVFLQIHDGRSSADPLLGRFCGDEPPMGSHITSSQHNLYLWFLSNTAGNRNGFALHWNSVTPICGGEVNATVHGAISSPGSPGKYPPNRDCYWHLSTSLGKRIQLHFFQLDIESHNNCSFDYLAIYDGYQTTDDLLEKYCRATQPAPLQSSGPEMLIHFHSDALNAGKGFQITYAPVEGVPGCGGVFSGDRGEVSSPSYDGSYMSNLLCEYKIRTGQDTQIQLDFKLFKLERSRNCKRDYLKIYDGSSSESRIMGTFCGELDRTITLNSTSNNIFMVFKSDRSRGGEGFRISYRVICNYFVRGDSGIIKSPGYPFTYPDNRVCEYVIETTPGKAIQLFFQDFDIEGNNTDCYYDNVEIRDGLNVNSTLLGKFCGNNVPPTQTSSQNIMYVRFSSDMSQSGGGFYANFTTINIECGGIYKDSTGTITHPSVGDTYKRAQKCTWIILAPAGKYIKLTWDRFEIEHSEFCTADYLELIMIDDSKNTSRKYCGYKLPPTLTIPTNNLMMKFDSDMSIQVGGFSVTYTFMDSRGYCGGHLIQNHGIIYSPGWPNRYGRNLDCIWTISVPTGQQIKLNISHFQVEDPNYRTKKCDDFLRVTNGPSSSSPLIGEYCGEFNWKSITSTANSLYLHFHSDFLLGGKGFKIKWDSTVKGCGGTFTGYKGSISSPNYPEVYQGNSECFYRICTNQGSTISMKFIDFDLEKFSLCEDHVEIFDGRDPESRSLGKFCKTGPQQAIVTTSNYAFIKFKSDFAVGGKGFLLSYNAVCNNTLTGYYGVIESLNYPDNYPINLNCTWMISVPKGSKINVTFTHFDVRHRLWYWDRENIGTFGSARHRIMSCNVDYVLIGEPGKDNTSRYCGLHVPTQISTAGNLLKISFYTRDIYVPQEHSGFRLEWLSYGCRGHIKKASGYFNKTLSSSDVMECEWLIEVPVGKSIKLSFGKVYMLETSNCTTDAIEIYNGPTKDSPLLTKLCHISGNVTSVISTSNYLLVKLIKTSSLKDVHFSAAFISTRLTCGGYFKINSGFITSKNYPKNYDNNLDCTWTINVPSGHRVTLEFSDIDLNNEENDCRDSIKLYDTTEITTSNYTHIICGNLSTKYYISKSNVLVVQFVSNEAKTAKGFKANFAMTCGGVITLTENSENGVITNENFKSHSNSSCLWTILAPTLEEKVSLTLTHLSLPIANDRLSNQTCPNSYLRILDGDDENAPLINEYCGRTIPETIVTRGSALTVILGTHDNKIIGVFSAYYSAVDTACGGIFTSESGVIASPNYPAPYPVNAVCEWILKTSPGNRVSISIDMLDLSYSQECNEDYLEVRENDGAGRILGLYCGSVLPVNATSASKLYIKFRSDNKSPGRGFLIHYSFVHGYNIIDMDNGEISSPLYPRPYDSSGEFWWLVTSGNQALILEVDKLQIDTHSELCDDNNLSIYDGFDDEAPPLKKLCGALHGAAEVIRTTSNGAYIKLTLNEANTGALFHLRWSQSDRDIHQTIEHPNCGNNETVTVRSYGLMVENFSSPNYPEHYNNEKNCEWIFKATSGQHLTLKFIDFDIEEREPCTYGDFVSIYESDIPAKWKSVKENMCLKTDAQKVFSASTFMKITFRSDSSYTKRGFSAIVKSVCGANLTDPSGYIELAMTQFVSIPYRCDWKIKVRPGRRIKVKFINFNIKNKDSDCQTYIVLHNGESLESPRLSDGKYCGYSHENRSVMITTGNNLFVSFIENSFKNTQRFKLHYEEIQVDCGGTSKLNNDHAWEVISTPNYPNVPDPYMECNWLFTGLIGEILRVDFIERFDVHKEQDCISEFVEIHDGSSALSPTKGHFCGQNPGTVKSSGNSVFIKYITDRAEPNNGFKANISIDVCGGIITTSEGEIASPGYPNGIHLLPGTICEWHIIGHEKHSISITPHEMNLPESESNCTTKVTIEEFDPVSNVNELLKSYCNLEENEGDFDRSVVQTSDNRAKIKLYIGTPSKYNMGTIQTGFRLSFKSSKLSCRGTFTASEGYITTPSYPRNANTIFCQWKIEIPDQKRRVTLEILDSSKNGVFIGEGPIRLRYMYEYDMTSHNTTFKSSGNTMNIFVRRPDKGIFRFKAKFTAYERAICGGSLSGVTGQLKSPDKDTAYFCNWSYNGDKSSDLEDNINSYQSLYVTGLVNSSDFVSRSRCRYYNSKVSIDYLSEEYPFCNQEVKLRIPSKNVYFRASQQPTQNMNFNLQWRLQPCGGVVHVGENSVNIFKIPLSYNNSLDCAWALSRDSFEPIEIRIEGKFQSNCDEEFIKIGRMSYGADRHYLFDYCKDKTQKSPDVVSFRHAFIEYHSKKQSFSDIKMFVRTATGQCGGRLNHPGEFSSPNFPKGYDSNMECEWEIQSVELGFRVSLQFINRFAIEKTPNCTKDAVIIYDWKDDTYIEIAKLCGRNIPPVFNSTYDKLKIVMRTDNETNLDGFQARWTTICGGTYYATDTEQYLYSPGYPYYWPSETCTYKIISRGKKIGLKFLDFNLEGYPESCDYDNLTISSQNENMYYFEVFCGNEIPEIKSLFTEVKVVFNSDSNIQQKGFKLAYSLFSCSGHITHPTTISSGSHENYHNNLNCTCLIEAPKNKIVVLKVIYFHIEKSYECMNDYLAVYEGSITDVEKRLALLCGDIKPSTAIRSKGNTMTVQFISDAVTQSKGFKIDVTFTYSESVGCGGDINITTSSHTLTSPHINSQNTYENFLDCHWNIYAPLDHIIRVSFSIFDIAPCRAFNQTALGDSQCDCDFVEIKDGINPDSLVIGSYCGNVSPPEVVSSGNILSIRLSTDGEITSSGFTANLIVQESVCGPSLFDLSHGIVKRTKSPGYDTESIPRGLHCVYRYITSTPYQLVHIHFNDFDLLPGTTDAICDKDKIYITSITHPIGVSLGKDYIQGHTGQSTLASSVLMYYSMISNATTPEQYVICGSKKSVDLYTTGSFVMNLFTSPEQVSRGFKGVDVEVSQVGFCGRNFTELYARVTNSYDFDSNKTIDDCYTLISVPDNYTISIYFSTQSYVLPSSSAYLVIYDGNTTSSTKLKSFGKGDEDYTMNPLFSTNKYILLHNHLSGMQSLVTYDFTYIATDKGRGCGGYFYGTEGTVTSPLYPAVYRYTKTCEWVLETPHGTRVSLHFETFDLGSDCDHNYVQLVDRAGRVLSSYCSETPADYSSVDNYVKIVFVTTRNNGGTGWKVKFFNVL